MKRPSASSMEQALSTAIDRKLDISEERAFTHLVKSVCAYLVSTSIPNDKSLLDDALLALDAFAVREVQLMARLQLASQSSHRYTQSLGASVVTAKSEIQDQSGSSKQDLVEAKKRAETNAECSRLGEDFGRLPSRSDIESQVDLANQEKDALASTSDSLEESSAKRMRKLEYIMSLALELKA